MLKHQKIILIMEQLLIFLKKINNFNLYSINVILLIILIIYLFNFI